MIRDNVWVKYANSTITYSVSWQVVKNDNGLWDALIIEELNGEESRRIVYETNTGHDIAATMASKIADETVETYNSAWKSFEKEHKRLMDKLDA